LASEKEGAGCLNSGCCRPGSVVPNTLFKRSRAVRKFVPNTIYQERPMKKEKPELDTKKPMDEQVTVKSAEPKKKKNEKLPDETITATPKVIKTKPEKSEKATAKTKDLKAPKEDKFKAPKEDKLKAPKDEKLKAPKDEKLKAPKDDKLKAPKDDKLTKFLVSMKKSVRKSIKKEAAEVGVSMNEYIVLAVVEKLNQNSLDGTK
jgi:predicted HicB family RNase H-like nuclease